ncbi:YpjP family protein [Sutcliffiella rhizosphaerae]|uniref:YpjP-like protein n=1 Tax=Sutcliffiella rhizosphaerae TaxID=2880967 RepID=A0ABM8YPS0_9BACI|nr:YpjP family protein [Sutcliffiella rhizosphaerae]CAG9622008.1 hypothetical protein BACCIP111883_02799 [Sutcliffiella rhizosphaerae]
MPKWLKKSLVALITALTFGTISPPAYLTVDDQKDDSSFGDISNKEVDTYSNSIIDPFSEEITKESFMMLAKEQAKTQSLTKFGNRIGPKIQDEFSGIILPKMETVIQQFAEEHPTEDLSNLAISEKPGGGDSEKIFHIYHAEDGNDLIRFHVRKDHPPLDGYYFNFHYHTHHDNFQNHHLLGSIYWAKNTPPKWLS